MLNKIKEVAGDNAWWLMTMAALTYAFYTTTTPVWIIFPVLAVALCRKFHAMLPLLLASVAWTVFTVAVDVPQLLVTTGWWDALRNGDMVAMNNATNIYLMSILAVIKITTAITAIDLGLAAWNGEVSFAGKTVMQHYQERQIRKKGKVLPARETAADEVVVDESSPIAKLKKAEEDSSAVIVMPAPVS